MGWTRPRHVDADRTVQQQVGARIPYHIQLRSTHIQILAEILKNETGPKREIVVTIPVLAPVSFSRTHITSQTVAKRSSSGRKCN